MAGEAAIRKVLERTHDWLDGKIGAGVALVLDRAFDEAFRDEDLPLVNLRCQRVDYDLQAYSQGWRHEATIAFDIITPSATARTIDQAQAEIAADIVARMAARTGTVGTIGELLQFADPLSMGGGQDDYAMADQGETTFLWRFVFLTPPHDFRTIVGHNGLVS